MGSQKYADLSTADPSRSAAIIARNAEKCRRMPANEHSAPAVPLARVVASAVEYMRDYAAMNPETLPVFIVSVDSHLRLEDNGPLMERALINLFVNATQAAQDAGLGLHIVETAVAACGDTISAASQESGGAVFTMRFPVSSGAGEPDRGPGNLKSLAASAK